MEFSDHDRLFMEKALELADAASRAGEVPVGAIVTLDQSIIGQGYNHPIGSCDPTAHAEIQAIRAACAHQKNYRLPGATLYVTLEPCSMCAGAIVHARLDRLIFAACEPKAGAIASTQRFFDMPQLNHRVEYYSGLCQQDASAMLSEFFRQRRDEKKRRKT